MSTKFYTLLTDIGAAKLASAAALGVPLKITHMAVGDGGGVLPTPDAKQTALVNEKRRAALNMLYIDPQNSSQIIAEQVIPENEGGWWIREVGLFDESGALIAVGNCPESYKPQLAEGSGRTQTVRMVLITSSTDNITLKIDPAVVLATRKYVDDKALELKVYADDQMAKHLAAPDPHSQYAPKASPTFTGTPKAPTPAEGNNTTQLATTAFVQAALTALISGAPATLDTLKEIAAAINNDPKFSTTINNALELKAPLSSPALTGTPTAPTAEQSVNNTQIATTAFVKSAIAAMVGSAPAALDTLNELAAALGNDPNFATTMLNALAGKQPLDNTLTNLSGKDVAGLLTYLGLGEAAKLGSPDFSFSGSTFIAKFPGKSGGSNRTIVIQGTQVTIPQATSGNISTMSVNWPTPFPTYCQFTIVSPAGTTHAPAGGPFFGVAPVDRMSCNVSSTYTASASSAFILGVGY
ncbi:TPA: phage tail protein [Escherichia coli]|nr:phage tail protein [Escherichia coli]